MQIDIRRNAQGLLRPTFVTAEVISTLSSKPASAAGKVLVVEGDAAPDPAKAVLVNAK